MEVATALTIMISELGAHLAGCVETSSTGRDRDWRGGTRKAAWMVLGSKDLRAWKPATCRGFAKQDLSDEGTRNDFYLLENKDISQCIVDLTSLNKGNCRSTSSGTYSTMNPFCRPSAKFSTMAFSFRSLEHYRIK